MKRCFYDAYLYLLSENIARWNAQRDHWQWISPERISFNGPSRSLALLLTWYVIFLIVCNGRIHLENRILQLLRNNQMATFCPRPAYRYRPHSRRPPINPADYYLSLQFRSARTCVIDECGFEQAVCVGGGSISKCSSMELVWAILFQFFRSVGQNLESALMLIDCASSLFGSH